MDETNVLKTREVRCSACKLPADVLAALHGDRFENGMTFEDLVGKYGSAGYSVSESGLRRHMAKHAAVPEDSPISGAAASGDGLDPALNSFVNSGGELDAHALLEGGTRTLFEVVKMLEEEYRTTAQQNPQSAQRVLDKLLKAHALLARSVKQLEEGRTVRDGFRKTVPQIVDQITSAALRAILPVMRENAEQMREDVVEYAHGRLSADEFGTRLMRLEVEWPREVGTRMKAATREALKTEEAKVTVSLPSSTSSMQALTV